MKIQDLNNLKILANKYTSIYDVCRVVRRETLYGDNKSLAVSLLEETIPNIRNNISNKYLSLYNIKEEVVLGIRTSDNLIDLKDIIKDDEILKDLHYLLIIENNLKMGDKLC